MAQERKVSIEEISAHNTPTDVWIVVDGKVWDITDFVPEHPGGPAIILKYAGRDATKAYNEIHAPSLISSNLPTSAYKGTVDKSTINDEWLKPPPSESKELAFEGEKPPLETLISSYDFETVASKTLTRKTWAFYSSAATDLITQKANKTAFDRILFRPRILRNVRDIDISTTIMGLKVDAPFFISPAALARLVHPDGEKALGRAAKAKGIIQCVSTNASYPIKEIVADSPDHPFFFQLYVDKHRPNSEVLLANVEKLGIKAIFLTVDAPVPGKREADERIKADESMSTPMSKQQAKNDSKGGALGRVMSGYIDANVSWADLAWLRRSTKVPIVLKGIQSAADAVIAMEMGVDAIVLSNHGGRSLDTAPPPIFLLLELHRCCPQIFDRMEIYLDGGIRRGTDILKALCLGATAVGLGRPFLYALNYGQEGVEHFVDILRDELEVSMRMIGITDLSQVHPGLVNTLDVDHLIPSTLEEHPYARWVPKVRLAKSRL